MGAHSRQGLDESPHGSRGDSWGGLLPNLGGPPPRLAGEARLARRLPNGTPLPPRSAEGGPRSEEIYRKRQIESLYSGRPLPDNDMPRRSTKPRTKPRDKLSTNPLATSSSVPTLPMTKSPPRADMGYRERLPPPPNLFQNVGQAWQAHGPPDVNDSSAERVKLEVAASYQMAREAHQHLKVAHQQLQEERLSTIRAKKQGEQALAEAEKIKDTAQDAAKQLREGAENRLVRQLAAQRRLLEKEMRQSQHEMKLAAENASSSNREQTVKIRELKEAVRNGKAELAAALALAAEERRQLEERLLVQTNNAQDDVERELEKQACACDA